MLARGRMGLTTAKFSSMTAFFLAINRRRFVSPHVTLVSPQNSDRRIAEELAEAVAIGHDNLALPASDIVVHVVTIDFSRKVRSTRPACLSFVFTVIFSQTFYSCFTASQPTGGRPLLEQALS